MLDRLALLISALSGVTLFLLIGRGGWYIDDFLNLAIAQESQLGRMYIDRPIFGHPQQATRFLNWVLYRISPMNYALAASLVCLAIAFMTWMIYRILRLSFRPSPWLLVLTAMAGLTGLWVPVAEWWAGGSEIGGCVVANVLMVHALLRCYLGPKRLWWAGLAGLWLLLGLCFYERALLGGLFAACFLLAVAARQFSVREIVRVGRQALAGYLVLLVVAVGYLIYYASHKFVHTQPGYTHKELLHFFWTAWSSAMIPGLFGGSIRTGRNLAESYASPPIVWLTVCQLFLLGLVAYGVRKLGWRALVGWLFFIPIFLAACYAIATARLHVHGPGVGREYRYVADLVPLGILTLALTVLAPRVGRDVGGSAATVVSRPAARSRGLVLPAAALVALVAIFLSTGIPVSRRWVNARTVDYVRNMQQGIRAQDAKGPYSVYTAFVPGDVSTATYGRYSLTTRVAQLVSGHPISADDLSRPMFMFDPNGHLVPARFQALATVPDACGTVEDKRIMQPLNRPLGRGTWTVQLSYRVPARTTLRFAVDTGTMVQEATGGFQGFDVSGSGRLTFQMRQQTVKGFRFDSGHPGDCISDVRIGRPVPAG